MLRNTVFSALGEGSNGLLFLLAFLAARYLKPEGFGEYMAAFAFVGLFRILPDFGMSYASTLQVSRDRSLAGRVFGGLLGFQALLSCLTLALCLGIGRVLFHGVTWLAVIVLSVDLLLKSVKSTLRWLLKSFELFGAEAASLLLERTALLLLGVWSLRAGWGVAGFVLVFAGVRLADSFGLLAWVHARVLPVRPRYEAGLWWDLLRRGLPFAYAGAMITAFTQVDAVMLEKMRGPLEVGYYGAPARIFEGLSLVPRILGYALIPSLAVLHQQGSPRVSSLYGRGCKYLLLAGLPLAAFGIVASRPFILGLFGPDYGPSVQAARLLIPAAAFMFLSNFGETTLACIDRWRTIVIVSSVALALNVGLNLLWIPRYGFLGAAASTLVTEAAYFAMTAAALRAFGHDAGWLALLPKPLAASAVFVGVLWWLLPRSAPVAAAAASAAFVASTFLLRVWDASEGRALVNAWRGGAAFPPRG
jgi:O-antigen/teichoic acid export membrane protein